MLGLVQSSGYQCRVVRAGVMSKVMVRSRELQSGQRPAVVRSESYTMSEICDLLFESDETGAADEANNV